MTRYLIDPQRSRVWIDARSSLHPIRSSADGLEGVVELDLAADGSIDPGRPPTGRISLPVSRLSTGNPMEDRELAQRIDATGYPTLEGVLEQMAPTEGDHTYLVIGQITFRGVTCAQEGVMTVVAEADGRLHLTGSSRVDVRTFGLEPPRVLMVKVDPVVDVRVEIVAAVAG
jgi:hypothetical protein